MPSRGQRIVNEARAAAAPPAEPTYPRPDGFYWIKCSHTGTSLCRTCPHVAQYTRGWWDFVGSLETMPDDEFASNGNTVIGPAPIAPQAMTAADVTAIIRAWLDADCQKWGAFEKALDAAIGGDA